jgi:putative transposase
MGRRPRSLEAGIYHVAAHSSDTRRLFVTDDDREEFLALFASACERFEVALVSYVLMSNHYHALVRITHGGFSQALRKTHGGYSRSHNRSHGRSAHLFRAHPYVGEIGSNEQLVTVSRYLARNPVAAGLVRDPLAFLWSSAGAHAGKVEPIVPLAEDDLRGGFGEGQNWRERYRAYVRDEEGPAQQGLRK